MTPSGSQTPLSSTVSTASGHSDVVDISDWDSDPLDEVDDDILDLVSQSDDESEFADGYKLHEIVDTGAVPPFGISSLPRKPALHPLHSWYRGFSQRACFFGLGGTFGGILSASEACRQLGLSVFSATILKQTQTPFLSTK